MRFDTPVAALSLVILACCTTVHAQAYSLNENWFFLEDLQGEYIASIGLSEQAPSTGGKKDAAILSYFCTAKNELLLHITPSTFKVPQSQAVRLTYGFDGAKQKEVRWLSTGNTLAPYKNDVATLTTSMLEAETFSISLVDLPETNAIDFKVTGIDEGLNSLPCL